MYTTDAHANGECFQLVQPGIFQFFWTSLSHTVNCHGVCLIIFNRMTPWLCHYLRYLHLIVSCMVVWVTNSICGLGQKKKHPAPSHPQLFSGRPDQQEPAFCGRFKCECYSTQFLHCDQPLSNCNADHLFQLIFRLRSSKNSQVCHTNGKRQEFR